MRSAWTPPLPAAPSTAVPGAASTSPTAPTLAPQPLLARLGLATDLLLEGQWNVDTTESLRATASLRRTQGDLRILSAEPPAETTSVSTGQGWGRQRDHHHASIHRCHQPGTRPACGRQS